MWPYTPTEVAFLLLGSTWSDLSVGKSCRASQEGCSLTNQVIPISSSGKGEVDKELSLPGTSLTGRFGSGGCVDRDLLHWMHKDARESQRSSPPGTDQ